MRLSQEERERLDKLASKLHVKPAQYLRGIINGEIHRELDDEEVAKKIREGFKSLS